MTAFSTSQTLVHLAAAMRLDWSLAVYVLVGMGIGFWSVWLVTRSIRREARKSAETIVQVAQREAAVAAEEIRQKAAERIRKKRAALVEEFAAKEIDAEVRLREIRAHEESLALLDHQLEQRTERLNRELAAVRQTRDTISALSANVRERLEGISQMDTEAMKRALREEVILECQDELRQLRREIMERSEQELERQARDKLVTVMQRIAVRQSHDLSATIVPLPSEEMKGRIIGREGRNIKTFEAATGVTLLIDETPQSVLISSFDPMRREVARLALEALVKDGRIHPATIEEFVKTAQSEIDSSADLAGEEAVTRLSINGLHPEVISLLGKLKYRFAYNQNVLDHLIECAYLASMIASELGLDANIAKRAALLHDIGKAAPSGYEGSHAHVGAAFIKRYGETPIVVNAVEAHHEEVKPETIYAGIVILADTISAIRPGARAESVTNYIQRLERLEALANVIDGVQQSFAIQAGREIRVVVSPDAVDDDRAREIARELRQKVEAELDYPSTIKITVIREKRFTETAT